MGSTSTSRGPGQARPARKRPEDRHNPDEGKVRRGKERYKTRNVQEIEKGRRDEEKRLTT